MCSDFRWKWSDQIHINNGSASKALNLPWSLPEDKLMSSPIYAKKTYTQMYTPHKIYTNTDINFFSSNVTLLNFLIFLQIFCPALSVILTLYSKCIVYLKDIILFNFRNFWPFLRIFLPVQNFQTRKSQNYVYLQCMILIPVYYTSLVIVTKWEFL